MDPKLLTSPLEGGMWSFSRPGRFITRDIGPGTHWMGNWLDLSDGLDFAEKAGNLIAAEIGTPAVQPEARCCTDCAIQIRNSFYTF